MWEWGHVYYRRREVKYSEFRFKSTVEKQADQRICGGRVRSGCKLAAAMNIALIHFGGRRFLSLYNYMVLKQPCFRAREFILSH